MSPIFEQEKRRRGAQKVRFDAKREIKNALKVGRATKRAQKRKQQQRGNLTHVNPSSFSIHLLLLLGIRQRPVTVDSFPFQSLRQLGSRRRRRVERNERDDTQPCRYRRENNCKKGRRRRKRRRKRRFAEIAHRRCKSHLMLRPTLFIYI